MKFGIHKTILISALLACTASTYSAPVTQIPCPSLKFLQAHMNTVNAVQIVKKGDYATYTSMPFYDSTSKLKWQLGTDVYTYDFNTAYDIGYKRIHDTTTQVDTYAQYLVDFWLCQYADSSNAVVYLVSGIDTSINPFTKINK